MRGYAAMARNSIMATIVYRFSFIFSMLANIIVIIITYFLWKAIYAGADTIHGLDFNSAFTSVALSMTLYSLFNTYVSFDMCASIQNGNVSQTLLKPVDYQLFMLSGVGGGLLLNLLIVALPSVIVLVTLFHVHVPIGLNLIFFVLAIVLSFLINFLFDFMLGLVSFYTSAIWGLSSVRDFVLLLLSGALIPLNFFPDGLRRVVEVLPFRAIFAIPMQMLFASEQTLPDLRGLLVQVLWIVALGFLSRLFYRRAIRVVTVQGG